MQKVYFKRIDSYKDTPEISAAAGELLAGMVEDNGIKLQKKIPLKVHFGEKNNVTYIGQENFIGIIDYLVSSGVEPVYSETNAVYSGSRMHAKDHTALAIEHGFDRIPIEIADGDAGGEFEEVRIDKKHFDTCKIGRKIAHCSQVAVISHFKGHVLAGFGGAIKQLGMGCAARGGKLSMHVNAKPFIIPFICKKCGACIAHCPAGAIETGFVYRIDHKKCIGCAACIAHCPHKRIFINPLKLNLSRTFREKIAEYAFAAQKGKDNIYISFALNITKECDCMPKVMKPIANDIGIFVSTDTVAIDKACIDIMDENTGKKIFGGRDIFSYSQKIGLGSAEYELVRIN